MREQERKTKVKINYGIHNLHKIHEDLMQVVRNTDPLTLEWIACSTFLAEVYELEATKHGGLDAEKVKAYKAVCHEFLCRDDEVEQ